MNDPKSVQFFNRRTILMLNRHPYCLKVGCCDVRRITNGGEGIYRIAKQFFANKERVSNQSDALHFT
jgi:hypothetical protein